MSKPPEATSPERIAAERAVLSRRVERMTGELTTAATSRMEDTLPWFIALPANERASVSTIARSGIATFVEWFVSDQTPSNSVAAIFSSAPRDLARLITLQQTVELVRTTMAVVEESVIRIAGDSESRQQYLRESMLRYSREIAFAAAEVYARAAESRGAWDARLQDLILDSILAGENSDALISRASAAGWDANWSLFVMVGPTPSTQVATEVYVEQIRRTAKAQNVDVMVGVQTDRLITVIGGPELNSDYLQVAKTFAGHFGPGTVVYGPIANNLANSTASANAAISGYRAVELHSESARLVAAQDLIAARVINGDLTAIEPLIEVIQNKLKPDVRTTLATYLEVAPSIEGCARTQFIHVNTVRYRLKKVHEVTGLDPANPNQALTLRIALMLERKTPNL
jgi:sugar diacid utilization regulator